MIAKAQISWKYNLPWLQYENIHKIHFSKIKYQQILIFEL